jgi:hypothetical protein
MLSRHSLPNSKMILNSTVVLLRGPKDVRQLLHKQQFPCLNKLIKRHLSTMVNPINPVSSLQGPQHNEVPLCTKDIYPGSPPSELPC